MGRIETYTVRGCLPLRHLGIVIDRCLSTCLLRDAEVGIFCVMFLMFLDRCLRWVGVRTCYMDRSGDDLKDRCLRRTWCNILDRISVARASDIDAPCDSLVWKTMDRKSNILLHAVDRWPTRPRTSSSISVPIRLMLVKRTSKSWPGLRIVGGHYRNSSPFVGTIFVYVFRRRTFIPTTSLPLPTRALRRATS